MAGFPARMLCKGTVSFIPGTPWWKLPDAKWFMSRDQSQSEWNSLSQVRVFVNRSKRKQCHLRFLWGCARHVAQRWKPWPSICENITSIPAVEKSKQNNLPIDLSFSLIGHLKCKSWGLGNGLDILFQKCLTSWISVFVESSCSLGWPWVHNVLTVTLNFYPVFTTAWVLGLQAYTATCGLVSDLGILVHG